jgi:hypothetical protein
VVLVTPDTAALEVALEVAAVPVETGAAASGLVEEQVKVRQAEALLLPETAVCTAAAAAAVRVLTVPAVMVPKASFASPTGRE